MKRFFSLSLSALILAALLTGCAWTGPYSNVSTSTDGTVNGKNQRTVEEVTEDILPQVPMEEDGIGMTGAQ